MLNPGRETARVTRGGASGLRGEELFGDAFDGKVVGRFLVFVKPYKRVLAVAIVAVFVYTLTQIAVPLVIRIIIDDSLIGAAANRDLLQTAAIGFLGVVTVNYIANYVQLILVAKTAERILIDIRRAMYAHLQRVSLSFMDQTEVGRMMSRLQGDVGSGKTAGNAD